MEEFIPNVKFQDDFEYSSNFFDNKISSEAFYGLTGEVIGLIEPHSESDVAAILINFLTFMGNVIGDKPYFMAQSKKSYAKIFSVIVGQSAKSRKGSSLGPLFYLFREIDPMWNDNRIKSGLSSGEGLINDIAMELEKENGDIRLLVIEEEFGTLLKVAKRNGNTITGHVRKAWDGEGSLSTLTKKPLFVTKSHISILGQITHDELKMSIDEVDVFNGFFNRFIWLYVTRSKFLPEGGNLHNEDLSGVLNSLKECISFSQEVGEMKRDSEAKSYWAELYIRLSGETPGIEGAITSRGENQIMRIAMIYALLDKSEVIKVVHIKAAEAIWNFSLESVRFLFNNNDTLRNSSTKKLLNELSQSHSLTLTEISRLFNNNKTKKEISNLINELVSGGYVFIEQLKNSEGGKPTTVIKLNE